jgi:lipopolysaccharide transport system ATP-binding protein
MRAQEIRSKFDEIVAFAEVDRFLDTPVKRYSSGMYVRLAFAVAAHLESEILIVDEVLAVGDARFQKKCMGKMEDVSSKEGRTVLFVSHNMGAVRALCTKSAWLEKGAMRKIGPSPEVVLGYLEDSSESEGGSLSRGKEHEPLYFKKVVIRDLQGRETRTLLPDEPLTVEVHYFANKPISRPNFWIDVIGPYGHLFGASMIFDNLCPEMIIGEGMVTCRFGKIRLLPQTYTITLRAKGTNGIDVLTPTIPDAGIFQVTGTAKDFDMPGEAADQYLEHDTPIIVPYEWVMPNGKVLRPQWQSSDAQFGVIPQRMERGREQ